MKLGRRRPASRPKLALGRYLLAAGLPTPPPSVDYSANATAALANIYKNDELGDCVVAGGAHIRGVTSGNADGGSPVIFTDDQIVKMYSDIGGYIPGDSASDQGCDEATALSYWASTGFPDGVKFSGNASVDATNQQEVMTAISLFENVMFGIELPDSYVNPFPSSPGFVWDVDTPDSSNGHCIVGVGYDSVGVTICTWGMLGKMTWAAVAALAVPSAGGELFVVLSADIIAKGQAKAPSGLDYPTLTADLAGI